MALSIRHSLPEDFVSQRLQFNDAQTPGQCGEAPPAAAAAGTKKTKASAGSFSDDFTFTNIASALGVQQTQKTMAFQTNLMQQECTLQEHLALMLGGADGSGGAINGETSQGLYGIELHLALDSANDAESGLEDQAAGYMNSGYVGLGGLVFSTLGIGAAMKNKMPGMKNEHLPQEIENLEAFKQELEKGPDADEAADGDAIVAMQKDKADAPAAKESDEPENGTETAITDGERSAAAAVAAADEEETPAPPPTGTTTSTAAAAAADSTSSGSAAHAPADEDDTQTAVVDDAEAERRIALWKGSEDKEPSLGTFKAKERSIDGRENDINSAAIRKLHEENRAEDLAIVKGNVEERLAQVKEKMSAHKTQTMQMVSTMIGQASQAGSSLAQGHATGSQATSTGASQTESAEAQYFEKMLQSYSDQIRTAQQMANTYASEASTTAQQMAFQA